jgi:hypothetical protein
MVGANRVVFDPNASSRALVTAASLRQYDYWTLVRESSCFTVELGATGLFGEQNADRVRLNDSVRSDDVCTGVFECFDTTVADWHCSVLQFTWLAARGSRHSW